LIVFHVSCLIILMTSLFKYYNDYIDDELILGRPMIAR
jgi:hypothetical protein